jgi:acetolactate synthase regulatory subunit
MSYEPWTLVGLHAAVRFTVVAEAAPGLLPRLMTPFARRDLTPDSIAAQRDGDAMEVEIAMTAMPAEMVHLVEGNLRQTVGVRSVARRQEITGMARRRAV